MLCEHCGKPVSSGYGDMMMCRVDAAGQGYCVECNTPITSEALKRWRDAYWTDYFHQETKRILAHLRGDDGLLVGSSHPQFRTEAELNAIRQESRDDVHSALVNWSDFEKACQSLSNPAFIEKDLGTVDLAADDVRPDHEVT